MNTYCFSEGSDSSVLHCVVSNESNRDGQDSFVVGD